MAARCDLNGIKDALMALFAAANTTTASPIDLSSGLSSRVKKVSSVHPEMIPFQASHWPYVTCYIDSKTINLERTDIAKDQLSNKRAANVNIMVVGGIWNQNLKDQAIDPADKDINYLMENVELVLRSSPNLGGAVKWQMPEAIEYYSGKINETVHLRGGILKLSASIFY